MACNETQSVGSSKLFGQKLDLFRSETSNDLHCILMRRTYVLEKHLESKEPAQERRRQSSLARRSMSLLKMLSVDSKLFQPAWLPYELQKHAFCLFKWPLEYFLGKVMQPSRMLDLLCCLCPAVNSCCHLIFIARRCHGDAGKPCAWSTSEFTAVYLFNSLFGSLDAFRCSILPLRNSSMHLPSICRQKEHARLSLGKLIMNWPA
jgi:hypothetical protein